MKTYKLEHGNYDGIKHDGPFLDAAAHFEQQVVEYASEGFSYTLGAGASYVGPNLDDTAYWTGSEKLIERPDILQVHAPVPILGCAPILRSDSCYSEETTMNNNSTTHYLPSTQYQAEYQPERPPMQRYGSGYSTIASPVSCIARSHSTFLTPSELLVELSARENQSRHYPPSHRTTELSRVQSTSKPPRPNLSSRSIVEATTIPDSSLLSCSFDDSSSETITSHEKKRHYLECLEHYVAFLHEHFRRSGIEPVALERISTYRCLNSRSIRVSRSLRRYMNPY